MSHDFLEHYGKKGMKWGIRKDRKSGKGKSTKQIAKTLTNVELKKRVNRLNMEKQYSDLSKQSERGGMTRGKRVVTDIVDAFGEEYPKSFGKKAGKRGSAIAVNILGDFIEKKIRE